MEIPAFILTTIATAAGAVWVLRSKLSDIENALSTHVAEEQSARQALDNRVVKLERRRR